MAPDRQLISQMAEQLLAAGVRPAGVLLVHSSLKSLGPLPGGPETVVRALLEALGPQGTLAMPALSYQSVGPFQRVFDVVRTPSCIGAIPEFFRTYPWDPGAPGVRRSICPTHSVCAMGPQAESLLSHHHLDTTPCGEHSPFRKLRDLGGQVLMLGCGLRPNTSMHAIEELVEPEYLFLPEPVTYTAVLEQGQQRTVVCRPHNFRGWVQRYDRLADVLSPDELHTGPVLRAVAHVIECPPMWDKAHKTLQHDPLFFVDRQHNQN